MPAPAAGLPHRRRADVEQGRHRPERKPEPGRQHGPGIDGENRQERQSEYPSGSDLPPRGHGQAGHREHVEGTLGGHPKPASQSVGEGCPDAGGKRDTLGGNPSGQGRHPAPGSAGQETEKGCHEGDMEAGNRHQMGCSGAVEGIPQVAVDGPLVADRQATKTPA